MNTFRCLAAMLIMATQVFMDAHADSVRLVKDINTQPTTEVSAKPPAHLVIGSTLFFANVDQQHGMELWSANGSTSTMIKDIMAGSLSSEPDQFVQSNGILYFTAYDADHGRELWRSDGTAGGTYLLLDVYSGPASSNPGWLTVVGNTIYFAATGGATGTELWKTNGTPAGTVRVRDIRPGAASSSPHDLVAFKGVVYFGADDGEHGDELWRSNGTESGTYMVKELNGSGASSPKLLTVGNTVFYFTATGQNGKPAVWKSNGTEAGTVSVVEANARVMITVGDRLFYTLPKSTGATPTLINPVYYWEELWTLDGTQASPVRVFSGPSSSTIGNLEAIGTALYFTTTFSSGLGFMNYPGLYRLDLATNQVQKLAFQGYTSNIQDIVALKGLPYLINNAGLQVVDNSTTATLVSPQLNATPYFLIAGTDRMFFSVFRSGDSSGQLWKSNGTKGGTAKFAQMNFKSGQGAKATMVEANGVLNLVGFDGVNGDEVWRSDLTNDGTNMIADLVPGGGSTGPNYLTQFKGNLYFVGSDSSWQTYWWRSDGTAAGTQKILNVSSTPVYGVLPNPKTALWFYTNSSNTYAVWKSDGTPSGNKKIVSFPNRIQLITEVGGLLYFKVLVEGYYEFWRTDGTTGGTFKLLDSGPEERVIDRVWVPEIAVIGNELFFLISNQKENYCIQLWKTNGTVNGTVAIVRSQTNDPVPGNLTVMGGNLYFSKASTSLKTVWKLAPTATQPTLIDQGDLNSTQSFEKFVADQNSIYYVVMEGLFYPTNYSIRHITGTATGHETIASFTSKTDVDQRITSDGKLFFAVRGEETLPGSDELYVNDRNHPSAGTKLLKSGLDFMRGGFYTPFLQVADRRMFFINFDADMNRDLWISDGTVEGTRFLMRINTEDVNGWLPLFHQMSDGRIAFIADDSVFGQELWTVVLDDIEVLAPKAGDAVANGGNINVRWRTDLATAGSAVRLELWNGENWVAYLRDSIQLDGDGYEKIPLPPVPAGSGYKIRAMSLSNPSITAWSSTFTVTGTPKNAARAWCVYQ